MSNRKQMKQEFLYKDLSGDKVFDMIKSREYKDHKFLGGRIIEAKIKPVRGPSKVIELGFKHEPSGFVRTVSFNYKKIERMLKKELKYSKN